ncbi:MAG: tetratricopeptide repeat protein [Bacteroidota bacterium]
MKILQWFVLLAIACHPLSAQNSKENADFKLAINLYNDKLFDLATEQLKQFVASYPNTSQTIEARFYLGLAQLQLKHYDDARMTFQTFALTYQENPKAPDAWWNVGESYAATNNHREAALAFERVKAFHPKSTIAPNALLEAGKYFTLAGQPDDARRVLRIVLQEYPASNAILAARTLLGKMYFEEGNLDQARNELKRVTEGDPLPEARAQALLILGNIAQSMGQSEQARGNYQEIITKYPKSPAVQGAYLHLGKLFLVRGQYAEATENLKRAFASEGQVDSSLSKDALVMAGDAYAAQKDYSNAVKYYNNFFAAFPADTLVPYVAWKSAGVNAKAKNYKRSNELCNQVIKSDGPEWLKKRAQVKLARNAEDQGNSTQAVQHYDAYLDQFPDDVSAPAVLMRLAALNEHEGTDLRKAASYFEQLSSRFPLSPLADDALIGAARCYEQLREFDRSLQLYQLVATRFPASELRDETEQRIKIIRTFEAKDKDAGLERLALLLGDVVADRDKQGLAYRLGEVYFYDLKNYAAAAAQFTNAINSGVSEERLTNALFFRAKALEYLSWNDQQYRSQASEAYETFLASAPDERRLNSAHVSLFMLNANTVTGARSAINDILTSYPTFPHRDTLWLTLGLLQLQTDSVKDALGSFTIVARDFPSSPSAERAGYERFRLLQAVGLPDSTVAIGDAFIESHPKSRYAPAVLDALAGIVGEKGSSIQATSYYRLLADDFAYTALGQNARRKLANALLATGNYEEATDLYSELLHEQQEDSFTEEGIGDDLHLALGIALHGLGRTTEARNHVLDFVEKHPTGQDGARAYNLLGVIYQKEGSLDLATSYFRQAANAAPDVAATKEIAGLLFDNGNYADALKQYTSLAQSATKEPDKRFYESRRILSRLRNDDLAGVEKDIATFTATHKDADEEIASFELEKGSYHYRKEDYVNARKSFDRVADKYDETPSAPVAMYWIGKILEVSNKPQDAIKQFDQLQKAHPRSAILPRVYLALGNIHYNAEKWDEATQNYKRIVDDPNADPELLPYAMSNLIETYETAGIFDAALTLTRKYLELYPNAEDSFDKKVKIGILYQRLGYNDQSAAHLQSLLDQAGSDLEGELRYYIAEANYNKGDYQQAILDFLKVPYLVTKKGKIDWTANSLYMSGQSYEKMGRHDQALTMYQQIISRSGIDETFKAAAHKEIERVKSVLKKSSN